MAWTRVKFRDEEVVACCTPDGKPMAGADGMVPFMYKAGGKQYKTRPDRLAAVAGALVVEDFMALSPGGVQPAGGATKSKGSSRGTKTSSGGKQKMAFGDYTSRRSEDEAIQIWTDGACSGNPGPAGLGAIVMHRGEVKEASEYLGEGTNNIAELMAISRGLELIAELDGVDASVPVDVITDSSYCIGLLTKGWKPKANQALVAKLRAQVALREDIRLLKVPGHAGVPLNERADELARDAITNRP